MALLVPASVLLSLWRVGQRERGPKSPQSRGLVRLGRRGGAAILGLPVTAQHVKGCRGSPAPAGRVDATTPSAPTAGMGWQVDKAGREGDLPRLATG